MDANNSYWVFCFLFFLFACGNEVELENIHSTTLEGKYDLIRMESENPVDLDRDGNFSLDIMTEIAKSTKIPHTYFLEISEIIYLQEPQHRDHHQINLWAPHSNVFSDDQGNYLYTAYGLGNVISQYHYSEKANLITLKNNGGEGVMLSAKSMSNRVIRIQYIQSYYTTNGWERLTITSTYKRRI